MAMKKAFLDEEDDENNGEWIRLHRMERLFHSTLFSVGVQSIYEVQHGTTMESVVSQLRRRAHAVAEECPFLVSRLKTRRKQRSCCGIRRQGEMALWIPPHPDYDSFFRVVVVPPPANHDDHHDLNFLTQPLEALEEVKRGTEALDQNVPLAQLTLVQSSKNTRFFTLTLVISHVLGDLTSFYAIWHKLIVSSSEKPQERLVIERPLSYPGVWFTSFQGTAWKRMLQFGLILTARQWWHGMRHGRGALLKPTCTVVHLVNLDWVAAQKAQHKHDPQGGGVPYVTTADVLTAWFLRETQPSAAATQFNWRPHLAAFRDNSDSAATTTFIGNYWEPLVVFPDCYTAAGIRQTVSSQGARVSPQSKPGPGFRRAFCSAWHGGYRELQLPGCTQTLHRPFPVRVPWETAHPLLIVFRTGLPAPHSLGVAVTTHEPLVDTSPLGPAWETFLHQQQVSTTASTSSTSTNFTTASTNQEGLRRRPNPASLI